MNVVCEANPAYGIFKSQRPSRSAPFRGRQTSSPRRDWAYGRLAQQKGLPMKRIIIAILLSTAAPQAQDQKRKDDYSQFQVMAGPARAA
jgi:hypothetical protein